MIYSSAVQVQEFEPGMSAKSRPGGLDHSLYALQQIRNINSMEPFGKELLFRGTRTFSWSHYDQALLRSLARVSLSGRLFVNLSPRTIVQISDELIYAACAANDIYFEWTESWCSDEEFAEGAARINHWTKYGVRFVIDDFGTGRDGLQRLFAVREIFAVKLAREFLVSLVHHPKGIEIARQVNEMIRCSGALVIAEGIDTVDLLAFCQRVGLELGQGYLLDGEQTIQ
jgi:EAL domain-containing protein (putative c-di-GMP-specific phosphodiesterase class I)